METARKKMSLPVPSTVAPGSCPDPTPTPTQTCHTGTEMPHSETPEWFGYCSGVKRCDIGEAGPTVS